MFLAVRSYSPLYKKRETNQANKKTLPHVALKPEKPTNPPTLSKVSCAVITRSNHLKHTYLHNMKHSMQQEISLTTQRQPP